MYNIGMKNTDSYPTLTFESQQQWEAWLEANHALQQGVWLKFAKKDSGIPSVTYPEALDTALCYGWIDGLRKALDAQYYVQKFTPRRARSQWSRVNQDKVAALTAAGRMRPAGLRQVELAQADGRWAATANAPDVPEMPDDFQRELDANPEALAFFEGLNKRNRVAILGVIQAAKRPETRSARIRKFVDMLNRGEKLVP
jgi:uncharacterized protein YdeI (YjbR/CyaY-like superfamily)